MGTVRAAVGGYFLVSLSVACGGSAAIDKPAPDISPTSAAGSNGVAGSAGAPASDQVEEVDEIGDPGGPYPTVGPEGGSAFFWRGGLGNWFVSSADGSVHTDASLGDVIPPRGNSQKAYHAVQPSPASAIDLWAQLNHPVGGPVDLTAYAGVSVWARLDGTSSKLTVAFGANGQFADATTLVSRPHKVVVLTEDWAQIVVTFDEVGLNPASASSVDFVVGDGHNLQGLWVDDLAFLCRGACPK